jgi:gas vesicle protein
MSEKDNFGTGFLVGTIVGGVIGGILGTIIANKSRENLDRKESKSSDYSIFSGDDEAPSYSHLSLEDKINQLNHAIDDVKVTLSKNKETQME